MPKHGWILQTYCKSDVATDLHHTGRYILPSCCVSKGRDALAGAEPRCCSPGSGSETLCTRSGYRTSGRETTVPEGFVGHTILLKLLIWNNTTLSRIFNKYCTFQESFQCLTEWNVNEYEGSFQGIYIHPFSTFGNALWNSTNDVPKSVQFINSSTITEWNANERVALCNRPVHGLYRHLP